MTQPPSQPPTPSRASSSSPVPQELGSTEAGHLYIVTAPSGTGKTTLVSRLKAQLPMLGVAVSHTTREPRTHERNGQDYFFVDHAQFEQLVRDGQMLEYAENYGNYYGTSVAAADAVIASGRDLLLEIDWQGAQQVKVLRPQATWILIVPPSLAALEQRLSGRGSESADSLKTRLDAAQQELDQAFAADYLIVNDRLDDAYTDLHSVMRAQEHRFNRALQRRSDVAALFSKKIP